MKGNGSENLKLLSSLLIKKSYSQSIKASIKFRTDPVVIILILSPDKQKCMLGRQGRHPPRMYSAVAGFLESGYSF